MSASEPWRAVRVGVRVRLVSGTEARVVAVEDHGGRMLFAPWRKAPTFFMVYVAAQDATVRVPGHAIQEVLGD